MQPRATLFRPRPAVCRDQECLGQGACSSVYRGRQGDKEVALKRRGERIERGGWRPLVRIDGNVMGWVLYKDIYIYILYDIYVIYIIYILYTIYIYIIYIYWIYTVTNIDMRFGDLGVSEHGVSFPNYDHSKRDDDESMESVVQYLFRLTNPKWKIMDI